MKFFAFTSILLVCFQNAFSQTTLLQIKFENKENFILERDKKIIALKCDDTYIHKKLKENYSDDELLKEINKSIKEKLFTKYPENGLKAMTIIDFADKFAKKAISVIKPIPGDIQEELQLSNRYSVVHIPTRDVGQLYSFRDADPNGSLPTFRYYLH